MHTISAPPGRPSGQGGLCSTRCEGAELTLTSPVQDAGAHRPPTSPVCSGLSPRPGTQATLKTSSPGPPAAAPLGDKASEKTGRGDSGAWVALPDAGHTGPLGHTRDVSQTLLQPQGSHWLAGQLRSGLQKLLSWAPLGPCALGQPARQPPIPAPCSPPHTPPVTTTPCWLQSPLQDDILVQVSGLILPARLSPRSLPSVHSSVLTKSPVIPRLRPRSRQGWEWKLGRPTLHWRPGS